MARIQYLDRELQMATRDLRSEAINAELAKFAKEELGRVISSGEASPNFDRFVNNRAGLTEDQVEAPGPILYVFRYWSEIIEFALQYARDRSPSASGRYKRSWFAMADGAPIDDPEEVASYSEVIVTNDQPYSRKIEVGFMEMSVPPGVVEDTMRAVRRRFGNLIEARTRFVHLPGGYILKGGFRRGIRKFSRTKLRRDTMPGAAMSYPSLVMSLRS